MNQTVTLYRDGQCTSWGFRLHGGYDVASPMIIQRVVVGTPSQGELRRGDTILRIGNQDTSKMTHGDALQIFKKAGNNITLTIRRGDTSSGTLTPDPLTPLGNLHLVQNHPQAMAAVNAAAAAHKIPSGQGRGAANPYMVRELPKTNFDQITAYAAANGILGEERRENWNREVERQMIVNQPHRTFPLITPSVKAKKDLPIGSYLRLVTDPFARAAPRPIIDTTTNHPIVRAANESLMKQMVQETVLSVGSRSSQNGTSGYQSQIVNRQYNSPINVYSDTSIAQTLQSQIGASQNLPPPQQYQLPPPQQYQPPPQQYQPPPQQYQPPPQQYQPPSQQLYKSQQPAAQTDARPGTPTGRTPYNPSQSPTFHYVQELEPTRAYGVPPNRVKAIPPPLPEGHDRAGTPTRIPQSKTFDLIVQDLYGQSDL